MALNQTPASERIHIAFFGKRNAGKSSVMNAVTGQNLAVVSEVKGTTTDPVQKTMELLPLGPVMVIDTPGIDDEGELGKLRVKKSDQVLNKTDIAVLVVDGTVGMSPEDLRMEERFQKKGIPYLVVLNKSDLIEGEVMRNAGSANMKSSVDVESSVDAESSVDTESSVNTESSANMEPSSYLHVSAVTGVGIEELKEKIASLRKADDEKDLLEGLISLGDLVILVTPIDKAAPKGRMILPQQQTIRALLDHGCICMTVRETELAQALQQVNGKPRLIITDSQAFGLVSGIVPAGIALTSFSILFARYKGDVKQNIEGVRALETLQDGDRVLISEGCTHHRQCNDIGTVKLPGWIREFTGKHLIFKYTSGTEFPEDLSPYRLIVHCGACMINEREMKYRLSCAKDQNIPMTNYGILIAYIHGILKRSVEPFPDLAALLED